VPPMKQPSRVRPGGRLRCRSPALLQNLGDHDGKHLDVAELPDPMPYSRSGHFPGMRVFQSRTPQCMGGGDLAVLAARHLSICTSACGRRT
jgi:hypothetical protein